MNVRGVVWRSVQVRDGEGFGFDVVARTPAIPMRIRGGGGVGGEAGVTGSTVLMVGLDCAGGHGGGVLVWSRSSHIENPRIDADGSANMMKAGTLTVKVTCRRMPNQTFTYTPCPISMDKLRHFPRAFLSSPQDTFYGTVSDFDS